jgi:hypothetical protein
MGALQAGLDADLHLQARFEQSHLPQAITGLDLHLVSVNAAMSRLLSMPVEELNGAHVDDLTHPGTPASRAWELLEEGASGLLEYGRAHQYAYRHSTGPRATSSVDPHRRRSPSRWHADATPGSADCLTRSCP